MPEKTSRFRDICYFLVTNFAGCYVYAMGVHIFTQPYQIAPGGVTGIATIINYLWGLPIGALTLVLNIPLLVMSWVSISRDFTIRTAATTVLLSFCTDLFVLWMPQYPSASPLAPLLASLFGGVLMGVGNALVYMGRSTTGGTSIISALLQKKFPQFSMGKLLMVANFSVVILSIFAFGNIDAALYATLCIFTSSIVMDNMVYGLNTNRLLFIISDKSADIEARILNDLRRGTTILKGEGGYRHSQKNIIFCVVSKAQFYKVREIAMAVDEHAFIVACDAGDVLGKGFKHLD